MIIHGFIYLFSIIFATATSSDVENIGYSETLNNPKIKRDVTNLESINQGKESNNKTVENVIFVCGNETKFECECVLSDLNETMLFCRNDGITTANIRPIIINNFALQKVYFYRTKNLNFLEKGKILPGNENTIYYLTFSNVNITKSDDNIFDNFTSLETIDFFASNISFLNENVLTKKFGKVLRNLTVSNCNLNELRPTIFRNLFNLEYLDLNFNKQINGKISEKFPEALSKLKVLRLDKCNLTTMNDDTFEYLTSLEVLHLAENKLTSIPFTFKFLSNLKTVFLPTNLIEVVKENDFALNKKLQNLRLGFNPNLRIIESCAFCNTENSLKQVYLGNNENLFYIDKNAFGAISNGKPPKLEKFNIENCNISVIHEKMLDWKNIGEFDFGNNPFACNCSMAWLFNDLMSNDSIYEKKIPFNRRRIKKFNLGCLGPKQVTPIHTYPETIVKPFSSCENSTAS